MKGPEQGRAHIPIQTPIQSSGGSHKIQGEYVLNTLFGLERVCNRYGTGMERTPSSTSLFRIAFDGLERRGLERNSGT